MATYSGMLAWRIPWTEEPGGLKSMGLHRVGPTESAHSHVLGLRCCMRAFSSCSKWWLLSSCGVQASHCSSFSGC